MVFLHCPTLETDTETETNEMAKSSHCIPLTGSRCGVNTFVHVSHLICLSSCLGPRLGQCECTINSESPLDWPLMLGLSYIHRPDGPCCSDTLYWSVDLL